MSGRVVLLFCFRTVPDIGKIQAADAKEMGMGYPAEGTFCRPESSLNGESCNRAVGLC